MAMIRVLLTEDDVIERLRARLGTESQKEFAEGAGVSPQYLSDVLLRRRSPGGLILGELGLEDVGKRYREVGR